MRAAQARYKVREKTARLKSVPQKAKMRTEV
jgi:hypothetical protein